ncbi:hypothetical protein ABG82_01490 [Mycobacteroides immunogenum]|uniref:Uncharacterized protein n=3 Tax=Mycobacteriaceae TaxID=1762 RepID=A0A7V8LPN8_9MYCO|nr:hypothetical protein ABG82_01490 [Mycobacteroides immunogenum]OHT49849.1 hypothetical protein BKG62_18900 [Mycobacteroides chelonae]ANO06622.1 hypothetical protein BAB75_01490 [Mycobacteroides immunogenum]KIU38298.1 hypothetical protein TL11_23500 [Mycobacteroides immunogenum]KPG11425.1 hypothetical protein AN908_12780 [Mycobacteroides immunogenum]
MPDVQKPQDDPYDLLQQSWPPESESAYRTAEVDADALSTTAGAQAESAGEASRQTETGMQGQTADSVSGAYAHLATQLLGQSRDWTAISGWMTDAASEIRKAKKRIVSLVLVGTSEIRDALDSELQGTPATPSSSDLIDKYRGDIGTAASNLGVDLDSIGHSLHGDPGSSHTPTYVRAASTPMTPTVEQAAVHQGITGDQPQVAPHQLPEMPRATTTHPTESVSATSIPSTPTHSVNPTLANLIGGQGSTPTGTPTTSAPHTSSPNTTTPSSQAHQPTEQHQPPRPAGLPRIPSIPLDGLPAAAAESVATAVSSAAAHQLPTAPSTITPSVPVSTGLTPGVSGTTAPVTPVAPGLSPIGGGGLGTPTATQPVTPAPQGTPAPSPAAPQQTAPPRSPAADLGWIQRTYGLSPGVEVPKPETPVMSALFIADLPESEAHLHRVLATLRQEFESSGWSQPLAVATIRRGFETKLVYVTSDGVSIHPSGVSLPDAVTPLSDMPGAPTHPDLSGSLMVSEKLKARIPRAWDVEALLSTVPADENSQSVEQFQELVESEELLPCKVFRGRGDVEADEALRMFARAAIGSAGCSDLDVESARLRAGRWVGVQPSGYGEVLSRWYLADAAEAMSEGRWGEAVYASEKYLSISDMKRQAA